LHIVVRTTETVVTVHLAIKSISRKLNPMASPSSVLAIIHAVVSVNLATWSSYSYAMERTLLAGVIDNVCPVTPYQNLDPIITSAQDRIIPYGKPVAEVTTIHIYVDAAVISTLHMAIDNANVVRVSTFDMDTVTVTAIYEHILNGEIVAPVLSEDAMAYFASAILSPYC